MSVGQHQKPKEKAKAASEKHGGSGPAASMAACENENINNGAGENELHITARNGVRINAYRQMRITLGRRALAGAWAAVCASRH